MHQNNRPLLIGLTGGIASGKSTVSKWFEETGRKVVYSDKLGHEVLKEKTVLNILIKKFGESIILNGKINREELGNIVFSDKNRLNTLNKILHPIIRKKCRKLLI